MVCVTASASLAVVRYEEVRKRRGERERASDFLRDEG
jgi:hypothetical protein